VEITYLNVYQLIFESKLFLNHLSLVEKKKKKKMKKNKGGDR